jgi:hypothetical protein
MNITTDFPATEATVNTRQGRLYVTVELDKAQRLECLLASLCALKQANDDIQAALTGACDELGIEMWVAA